ncbi:asparaginase domain-containing protein [bacterium]|nr:asparaginase domain-containing protein [bacterium]
MSQKIMLALICLMTFVFSDSVLLEAKKGTKKNIVILTTGGAISGTQIDTMSGEFELSSAGADILAARTLEVKQLANVSYEEMFNVPSQEMSDIRRVKLAKKVSELAKKDNVDAIIVTHGTDTIEETAYFLHLTVNTEKPIVFTGAIRASLHPSSDTVQNLMDAVRVAIHKESTKKGVLVVMNNTIISARQVQKNNTFHLQAIGGTGIGVMGYVYNEVVDFHVMSTKIHTKSSEFNIDNIQELPNVDIVYAFADSGKVNVKEKQKGVVLAGVGLGNINRDGLSQLRFFGKKGVQVVRSSRIQGEAVYRAKASEVDDKKYGFVASGNLNPQKARILLKLALTKTTDPERIQYYFNTY